MKMSYDDFEAYFREAILPFIVAAYELDGHPDYPARREAWNDTMDDMDQDNMLEDGCEDWPGLPDDLDD